MHPTGDVLMVRDGAASERLAYLIGRVPMRDRAAFKELYDLTNRFLFRVAIRHLRNADRAEDVLQESFMEAWQKAATYSATISKPMTWLMTIVARRSIQDIRVHGTTYDETARFYKLPRQTVASWVRRGIATLTGCMQS